MMSTIRIAVWEIKLTVRHISFWLALIILNAFDFITTDIFYSMRSVSYTSWGLASWLSKRYLYMYLMLGLIAVTIMRREQSEHYEEIIHSMAYSKHQFLLGRYFALIFVGCLFILPQHLVQIFMQFFVWKTPIHLSTYLSFFLITHLPAIALFSALSILVAGMTYRYQSITVTFVLLQWGLLLGTQFFIIQSEKLYGNLLDFRGMAMFATMDPILRWFPELKLILLNRLIYSCLAIIIFIIFLRLYRRRNETQPNRALLTTIVPLGVVIVLAASSYLTDWKSYLEISQAIDIIVAPWQTRRNLLKSNPAVAVNRQFETLDYRLTIQLDEANKQMFVKSLIKISDPLELFQPELVFLLDSGFEIITIVDDQSNPLTYTREGEQLVVYFDNNQDITSFVLQITYEGEVWQWEKLDLDTHVQIKQFVNTGWLSQYVTDRAIWLSGIYAWYPKMQINGYEHPARYRLTVLSDQDKVFITDAGHLLKTGTESGLHRYELDIADMTALVLASGPYTYIEHDRFKVYCLNDNLRFARNLIQCLDDKVSFYEMVTNKYYQTPFVVIQSDSLSGTTFHGALVLSNRNFSSYTDEFYHYQKNGTRPIDVKLAFNYLAHPMDGMLGLSSIALGIGSYIDSLYVKQLGFDEAYAQERKYRLMIATAEANDQVKEMNLLINRMIKETDPIQISWLPYNTISNKIWLVLDELYLEFGLEALCEKVQQMMSELNLEA